MKYLWEKTYLTKVEPHILKYVPNGVVFHRYERMTIFKNGKSCFYFFGRFERIGSEIPFVEFCGSSSD